MLSVFCSPSRYTQGRNATSSVAQEMKTLGLDAPALIVAGASAARLLSKIGLRVLAGHGLHYRNVRPIARIAEIAELNIGHAIVAKAALVGMERAVREMIESF